ncbi:MAG TPA: hypothetical protein VL860_07130 [Planctomycetota bacterium]|nr:hypothetical protein [Planctomycetota bacterium]
MSASQVTRIRTQSVSFPGLTAQLPLRARMIERSRLISDHTGADLGPALVLVVSQTLTVELLARDAAAAPALNALGTLTVVEKMGDGAAKTYSYPNMRFIGHEVVAAGGTEPGATLYRWQQEQATPGYSIS